MDYSELPNKRADHNKRVRSISEEGRGYHKIKLDEKIASMVETIFLICYMKN